MIALAGALLVLLGLVCLVLLAGPVGWPITGLAALVALAVITCAGGDRR